jgi:hypothetical protein
MTFLRQGGIEGSKMISGLQAKIVSKELRMVVLMNIDIYVSLFGREYKDNELTL